jgi:subtilisin family serine protease
MKIYGSRAGVFRTHQPMKPTQLWAIVGIAILFFPLFSTYFAIPGEIASGESADFKQNKVDSIENDYVIIHFIGPIMDLWKEHLTRRGVELFGYWPEFSFLANLNGVQEDQILNLPFITGIEPYLPEYKYSPDDFYWSIQNSNQDSLLVKVIFFTNSKDIKDMNNFDLGLLNELSAIGAEIITYFSDTTVVRISIDNFKSLANINDVLWFEPVYEFVYLNDVAAGIMDVPIVWENLSLDGTGQVVTVCDTGLDNGSYSKLHEDFRGRLLHAYAIGRSNNWSDADIDTGPPYYIGVGGHGTHVAGSVLGAGNHSAGKYKGMAYNASLVFQSTMTLSGGMNIPPNMYTNLFLPPYNSYNSKIHTNSWGTQSNPGDYTSEARQVDDFVWDYPYMIILFAAGNSQTQSNIFSPSTAKNCITVGASESLRPTLPGYGSDCNNIEQRASFSCVGTTDNRIKPDILAPGTGILSTRSSLIPDVTNHYWVGYDDYYAYAGGTSMATPITAGVVTLIRQYYTDYEMINPSAALVKATLLTGAEDMMGSGITPPPIPNDQEGWGRVNIRNSLFPELPSNLMYIDNKTGLVTGTNFTYTIEVENNSIPLNITLVWSDYPATASASVALVNDLHLNVTHVSTGKGYKGNVFADGWSSMDDADANVDWDTSVPADGYDNINNV